MIAMKGSLLKEFLNACELRGILYLNVDNSLPLPALEEKLEAVWRSLSYAGNTVTECSSADNERDECQIMTCSKLEYCASAEVSGITDEFELAASPNANSIANEIPPSPDVYNNNEVQPSPDAYSSTSELRPSPNASLDVSTEATASTTSRSDPDTSDVCHIQHADSDAEVMNSPQSDYSTVSSDTRGSSIEGALPSSPVNCTIPSIPTDLLNVSTPNLNTVEHNHSVLVPQPPPLCSTPAVETGGVGDAVRDQGSIVVTVEDSGTAMISTDQVSLNLSTDYGAECSLEYALPSIELSHCQGPGSDSRCTTSPYKSPGRPQSKTQNSSGDYSLPGIELSASGEPESDSYVTCVSSPHIETHDHPLSVSQDSSDDDSDSKLDQLFSRIRIQTDHKKMSKVAFRKSLNEFIVSDSEEVIVLSDDDVLTPVGSPTQSKSYQTPTTPATGLMFWGSPNENSIQPPRGKAFTCVKERRPFVERSNFFTPSVTKPRAVQPLTTPSAHKHYPRYKKDMLSELFELFNRTVFDNKLSDVAVRWNNRLCTTAGSCLYKGLSNSRTAVIELATKVCDSFDRLRDTLMHEMCHAACWVVDGTKMAKHGPLWRAWADKALAEHPGLQPITRCHDYSISFKYTYKCVKCDYKVGRHSKSVNLRTARCPCCESELELEPRLKSDGTPYAPRKLNTYAQFLKDNYSTVKNSSPYQTHAQILEKIKHLYQQSREETQRQSTTDAHS